MERLWNARSFEKLLRDMLANRVDAMFALEAEMNIAPAAVAAAIVRMDELGQAHLPLASTFIKFLITVQQEDGGWGDVATTALCIKALMTGGGQGSSVDRGLAFLKNLQKSDGLWPRIPIRRADGDPAATAFVLQQLGNDERFHTTVDVAMATRWHEVNRTTLEPITQRAWERAMMRCRSVSRTSRLRTPNATVSLS